MNYIIKGIYQRCFGQKLLVLIQSKTVQQLSQIRILNINIDSWIFHYLGTYLKEEIVYVMVNTKFELFFKINIRVPLRIVNLLFELGSSIWMKVYRMFCGNLFMRTATQVPIAQPCKYSHSVYFWYSWLHIYDSHKHKNKKLST